MGRGSTGAYTTKGSVRIELSYLLKEGYIKKGHCVTGILTWTNGSSIKTESKYTEEEKYLRLVYTLTDAAGKKNSLDYKIALQTKPSNLGKGDVLYFVCPQSGCLCRVLYRAYSSHIWKSRASYSNRIYYPLQISSKLDKYNERYWELENELENLYKKNGAHTYKGMLTKRAKRIERLERIRKRMDMLRWSPLAMPKVLRLALEKGWQ
jgi:hypothetical protein